MSDLKNIHEQIETIWKNGVDHIHADGLHLFIDTQQERIEKLEVALNEIFNTPVSISVDDSGAKEELQVIYDIAGKALAKLILSRS